MHGIETCKPVVLTMGGSNDSASFFCRMLLVSAFFFVHTVAHYFGGYLNESAKSGVSYSRQVNL